MVKGSRLSKSVALDLGSSTIYWCDPDTEEVGAEPNLALVDQKKGRVIEVGETAASALGRAEGNHEVLHPFRNGRMADVAIAERYFRILFRKLGFGRFSKPTIAVATPVFFTAAEKRVLASTMSRAGASSVVFVDSLVAAAVGSSLDIQGPYGAMVASIGAQTTFAGVMALGDALTSSWELVGGDSIATAISAYLRSAYNLVMIEADVEELKLSLLDLANPHLDLSARVMGRNSETGGELEATISAREIYDAASETAKMILETIVSALTAAPAEISNDLVSSGITLVGRASLTKGLDQILEDACSIPVQHSMIVERAVVIGTARVLGQVSAVR